MNTLGQWLHQHEILLVCAALVVLITVVLFLRWRSIWMWFVWFAITGLSVGALFMLRTPAASVTEHGAQGVEIIGYEGWTIGDIKFASAPNSLAEIEELIGKGGKPTLVEIYADWGFA